MELRLDTKQADLKQSCCSQIHEGLQARKTISPVIISC